MMNWPIGKAIVECVCGASLDDAPSHGTWTIGLLACEYRTCKRCNSTRAYMPDDVIKGRRCVVYAWHESSEIFAIDGVACEFESLLAALDVDPPGPHATIMRNGVVLARVFTDAAGVRGWTLQKPTREGSSSL